MEGIFELRGITSQQAQYFNVLAALPETTVVLIADLVETSPLPADPFDQLKAALSPPTSLLIYSRRRSCWLYRRWGNRSHWNCWQSW
jgi:hypothetical protein